jgi:hypothetical protein
MIISITGANGRGYGDDKLVDQYIYDVAHKALVRLLRDILLNSFTISSAVTLVSNGDVWLNHIAVRLYLDNIIGRLIIYSPAPWNNVQHRYVEYKRQNDIGTAYNQYHNTFSQRNQIDSLIDIEKAKEKGAEMCPCTSRIDYINSMATGCCPFPYPSPDILIVLSVNPSSEPRYGTRMRHVWDLAKCKKIHPNLNISYGQHIP